MGEILMRLPMFAVAVVAMAVPAYASDKPLYGPAPDWIAPSLPIDPAKLTADGPVLLAMDNQQRFLDDTVTIYADMAFRATSAQVLAQIGTVSLPWLPDKGDLTIHRVEILRGAERIDVLKGTEPFSILRREQGLEQMQMNGMLTATLPVQGLQVGDVLRVAFSVTQRDTALGGRMQGVAPLVMDPAPVAAARVRLVWPTANPIHWRAYPDLAKPVEKTVGQMSEVTLQMPLAKPADLPGDVPARYRRLPLMEATSFASWTEVSKVMAPLYSTDGLIAANSPIAAEVARIMKAETTPRGRAQAALRVVQDNVRYLLMGMNGGNYVPQKPDETWRLKYGDCKAKTLLLLAMLRAMGIESEATLASVQMNGYLDDRLPSPMAFDHVIVRATIDGSDLWLDGTGNDARPADLDDTPALKAVLPLRTAGADLMPLKMRASARPGIEMDTELDQTAGLDFPTLFRSRITLRGPLGMAIADASAQANAEQKREMLTTMMGRYLGDAQVTGGGVQRDAQSGATIITANGLVSTIWQREQKRYRMTMDRAVDQINFAPDRARATWRDIPVATGAPMGERYRTTVRLPTLGKEFTLEGDQTVSGPLAGMRIQRSTSLKDNIATIDERVDSLGEEIAPADIAAERTRVALAKSRLLRLIAPSGLPPRWKQVQAATKDGRLKAIEANFATAIANDPKALAGYSGRADFRIGIYDYRGAVPDLSKMIELEPDVGTYLRRAAALQTLGEDARALADIKAARDIDPSSQDALIRLATYQSMHGEGDAALALLQERIDQGGKDRFDLMSAKSSVLGQIGRAKDGVATLDAAIAERPGDPGLLNERCWVKGSRNVVLDAALKDCTKAIELADSPAAALDSRAMVYFRMDRLDDALADLDAALDIVPDQASSLFLRGIVCKRLGRSAEAADDLAGARLIDPQIDTQFKGYGISA